MFFERRARYRRKINFNRTGWKYESVRVVYSINYLSMAIDKALFYGISDLFFELARIQAFRSSKLFSRYRNDPRW